MKSGRDQMVIDPDPDEVYTKRKKRIVNVMMSSTPSSSPSVLSTLCFRRNCRNWMTNKCLKTIQKLNNGTIPSCLLF